MMPYINWRFINYLLSNQSTAPYRAARCRAVPCGAYCFTLRRGAGFDVNAAERRLRLCYNNKEILAFVVKKI